MIYHVVWSPKYRRAVLQNGIDTRLKQIIHEVCLQISAEILALEVLPDHVHLLLNIAPPLTIAVAIQRIKGTSSRILRQEYPWLKIALPALWASGYFSAPVSDAELQSVTRYIRNQKLHHRLE